MVKAQELARPTDPSRRLLFAVLGVLVALYVVINIFSMGGDAFVILLNNLTSALMSVGVTIYALIAWRQAKEENQSSTLWTGFAIGWVLWSIAEVWWAVASIQGNEVPYPSMADIFWLVGYLPMFYALSVRIRSLPRKTNWIKQMILWGISVIVIGTTVIFILKPAVIHYDPTKLLKSTLDGLYPLADLILLLLALWIFFEFQQSDIGRAWFWLSLGFSLHALSNLNFSYASDQYYLGGKVNIISTVGIDIPYTLGYVACLVGLYLFVSVKTPYRPGFQVRSVLPFLPNTNVLVFTKSDDRVTGFSKNFDQVFPTDGSNGSHLEAVIGLTREEVQKMSQELRLGGSVNDYRTIVKTQAGNQPAGISGLPVIPSGGEYEGSVLLVRVMMASHSLDDLLTEYERSVLNNLVAKTGLKVPDVGMLLHFLTGYYSPYLRALYAQALTIGGEVIAQALRAELESVSARNGWRAAFLPDCSINSDLMTLNEARVALPDLLEAAKRYCADIIGEQNVTAEMHLVDAYFTAAEHENAVYLIKSR
jgi:hypothetical protein